MTHMNTADWRVVDERGDSGFVYIDRGPAFDYLQMEPEEHARFIVLACNLHHEMKEALEPFANLGVGPGPDDENDLASYRILRGAIRNARAVLAKLQGA